MSLAKSTLWVVQKLHICEKEYFDQLLDFPILHLLFLHTLLLCHIQLFECWIFFTTIRVSKHFGSRSGPTFCRPDPGPNCLQRLSADDKVTDSCQSVKYRMTSWYYFLAKVNFIWLQLFLFGWSVGYNKLWARVSPEYVLKYWTLATCQEGKAKQQRSRLDCFWRSSLMSVFPVWYLGLPCLLFRQAFCDFQPW